MQRAESPEREFILLQNQGGIRLGLRGHVVLTDATLDSGRLVGAAHAFGEGELIPPGAYVLLGTGCGQPRWTRSRDGTMIFYAYMNRGEAAWREEYGQLHILGTQHSYAERREPSLAMR